MDSNFDTVKKIFCKMLKSDCLTFDQAKKQIDAIAETEVERTELLEIIYCFFSGKK